MIYNYAMKYLYSCLLLLMVLGLCSCERKELFSHEELYTAPTHISADWQGQSATASALQIRISGTHQDIHLDTLFTLESDATATLALLEAEYHINAWHDAANVSFDGSLFHLSIGEDGLLREPSHFCAAESTVPVNPEQENRLSLKMYPQTRMLKLSLNVDKGSPELITGIEATLSGVAAERSVSGTTPRNSTTGNIRLNFTQDGNTLSAGHRLLGIASGVPQELTLTLHYSEGEPQTETYNLSPLLTTFNRFDVSGSTDMFTLTGKLSLYQSVEEAGISGSIEDWTPGTETDMDANGYADDADKADEHELITH